MEAPEDVMGSPSSSGTGTGTGDHSPLHPTVLKRKRSKRPPPPRAPPVAASSSSTSSADYLSSTTEEEEDMAHCLILLARGGALVDSAPPPPAEKFTSRRFTETTTTAGGKAGFYVYECKTCNKCFPSFQALGGHRASHKKPKMAIPTLTTACEDKNLTMNDNIVEGGIGIDISTDAFSKPASAVNVPTANSPTNNKKRVHECSICGAEFSSGQALGGHMRRHRPIGVGPESSPSPSPTQEVVVLKKERNVLSLDLNLPAPADENPPPPPVAAAFLFDEKRPMVLSATSAAALVDCHY